MPESQHQCPAECGRTVGYRLFACPDDWRRLPTNLKASIVRTYRRNKTDPGAHRAAMLDATNWFRAHPVKQVRNG